MRNNDISTLNAISFNLIFSDLEVARALGDARPPNGVRVVVGKQAMILLSASPDLVLQVSFHFSGSDLTDVAAWTARQIRRLIKKYKKKSAHINGREMTPTDQEILELMQEVINGQKPKKTAKRARSQTARGHSIKKPLKQLINALDKIFEQYQEVGDTAVREQLYEAVHHGFIAAQVRYTMPADFGMFSEEGNKLVRAALMSFLAHPDVAAAANSLKTPDARLAAFQDATVESDEGNTYDEYFGYAENP